MISPEDLLAEARKAALNFYAPYSNFAVGAALVFDDGAIFSAANVENASLGLSLCAETNAVARAMNNGRRGGLLAVAIVGPAADLITPCGRCRQLLSELAQLGGTDPLVWCSAGDKQDGGQGEGYNEWRLSQLLPAAFGPYTKT